MKTKNLTLITWPNCGLL
uniref:Uncharacterized protein n=1 Tax=Rhizophora mucronata TaxID=61149 RepID=A0A2P2PRP1_RHIMU